MKSGLEQRIEVLQSPVMIVPPALKIKNPIIVLEVPVKTSVPDFFCANKPIIATSPNSTAGVLKKLIIKSIFSLPF